MKQRFTREAVNLTGWLVLTSFILVVLYILAVLFGADFG